MTLTWHESAWPAKWTVSLFSPSSGSGCLTDARPSMLHEVHVFPLKGRLRGNAITKRPHNLHFFHFQALDTAFFSPFVQGGCWFLRWKTLVWQPSKSHRTLKVTCVAELFFLHFTSNIKVMIKRIRAEGEATRCLLWSKQQYQSPDPHEALLRIVLQLIPESRHITIPSFKKC